MKAKEIILLLLIIAGGTLFYHLHTGKLNLDWCLEVEDIIEDIIFQGGKEFSSAETRTIEPPFPSLLRIDNSHGNVEIKGTEEEKIIISFEKIVRRKTEEKARTVAEKIEMLIGKDENKLTISTNRAELRRTNFETHFRISVPSSLGVEIRNAYGLVKVSKVRNTDVSNRHGEVIVSEIGGELYVKNSYEDLKIDGVQSNCKVESRHSNLFINNILGRLEVKHAYGKVQMENISQDSNISGFHSEIFGQGLKGGADVETSYKNVSLLDMGPLKILNRHGDIEIEKAKGRVEIKHSYGKIKLEDIQGDLHVEGKSSALEGRRILSGKILISSSYENIELMEYEGEVSISLTHGDLTLEPLALTHSLQVKGTYSNINLIWPRGNKYPFEAMVKGGDIRWKLPQPIAFREENQILIIKAFPEEKEKPSISVSTTYGIISVEESTLR